MRTLTRRYLNGGRMLRDIAALESFGWCVRQIVAVGGDAFVVYEIAEDEYPNAETRVRR